MTSVDPSVFRSSVVASPVFGMSPTAPYRQVLIGSKHMASAGHFAAAHAAFVVMEAGGNAADAGVAAGLAMSVLQSELVSFAGVAPLIYHDAASGEVVVIDGLGTWPEAASADYFRQHLGGVIPDGLLRAVVPAAPAAYIALLDRFGTMSFGDVARFAIDLARNGFPMHPPMTATIAEWQKDFARWPENAKIYLPDGAPPVPGKPFFQPELADSIQYMVDEEKAVSKNGRKAGLQAARDAFYKGDIAQKIVAYHKENGGWMTAKDMDSYQVRFEKPVHVKFRGADVYTCGPWCQGPTLAQMLRMLDGYDLAGMGHNSAQYLHLVAEVTKLVYADREAYYGDPLFVDVPMDTLLSDAYVVERRKQFSPDKAYPAMPFAGTINGVTPPRFLTSEQEAAEDPGLCPDTSYVAVIDRHGNAASITPSDATYDMQVIPGTGISPSSRGCQSRTIAGHPSEVAPGKRPRLTPNPAMAILGDRGIMPFGAPGGDIQPQAMMQVFLNVTVFGMNLQDAIEAPRIGSYSFPNSFVPHDYFPGRLAVERRIPGETIEQLRRLGHKIYDWPDFAFNAAGVSAVAKDYATGTLTGGFDPRRSSYAAGW